MIELVYRGGGTGRCNSTLDMLIMARDGNVQWITKLTCRGYVKVGGERGRKKNMA